MVNVFKFRDKYYQKGYSTPMSNITNNQVTTISSGMRIYIDVSQRTENLLIKVINKYYKDNNIDVKIVSNVDDANTIFTSRNAFMEHWRREGYMLYDANGNPVDLVPYTYRPPIYPSGVVSHDSVYEVKTNFKFKGVTNHTEKMIDIIDSKTYTFLTTEEFEKITLDELQRGKKTQDISPDKLRELLIEGSVAQTVVESLEGVDLKPYLSEIIAAYYLCKKKSVREAIKNKLLKRHEAQNWLYYKRYNDYQHTSYIYTMKQCKLEPDKEVVLTLVGFYQ